MAEPIAFLKITDPSDIEIWIAQNAVDAKIIQLKYQLEMAKIGEDWREQGFLIKSSAYVLRYQAGEIQFNLKAPVVYAYKVLLCIQGHEHRSHGIYFVANEEFKIVDVRRGDPEFEGKVKLVKMVHS